MTNAFCLFFVRVCVHVRVRVCVHVRVRVPIFSSESCIGPGYDSGVSGTIMCNVITHAVLSMGYAHVFNT